MRDDLAAATETLARAGVETPRADAEWLLAGLLGVGRATLALELESGLEAEMARRYAAAVRRRAGREPLQRILGWEGFRGLRLRITPDVLVPRPETEMLVDWSLALVPSPRLAIDVGTGSGCIACSIATERPAARVVAVDSSSAAAAAAQANAAALGLAERVSVVVGDLLAPVGGRGAADLVVANLPYIPTAMLPTLPPEVARYEPEAALDGGDDGLRLIRRLIATARGGVTAGGALVVETAGGTQTAVVVELMRTAGFVEVATRSDLLGVDRFVAGRCG
jgi:release factor glutamine methyltransferase